jgi:hypothetical protein
VRRQVPVGKMLEDLLLVVAEDRDVDVPVIARLPANPGVDGPSTAQGPRRFEGFHERRDASNGFGEELHSLAVDQVTGRIIGPMSGSVFLDESTSLLERMPRVLRELLADLPDGWLGDPDTVGGWTARDVVGHLISAELDDWIPRAEIIVRDGTSRPFEPFDRFAHVERDRGVPLASLLERFGELRTRNLGRLRELVSDDDVLDRRGRHPELGEVTLRQHVSTWTVHDLDHVAQIYSSLAASRDLAVGPWKAYLGILLRRDAAGPAPGAGDAAAR